MPELSMLLAVFAFLVVVGGLAGVLAGLLGVGGGIVLVPAFYYVFSGLGYDNSQLMQICLATSLATIIFTSTRSVLSHQKKGAVIWDILRGWVFGIALGAVFGVFVANWLRSDTLVIIFGLLALFVGLYMALGKSTWSLAPQMPQGTLRWVLSPLVGFLSVLMGIGGGSFGVPIMTLHGVRIHNAVATAAGFGVIIAIPSVILFLFSPVPDAGRPPFTVGSVNIVALLLVTCMTMMTAPLGVRLAHWMDPKPLKRVFSLFLMLVALNMLRKAFLG